MEKAAAAAMVHPYLPTSMELPGFHPALMTQMFILGTYGGASALVVLLVWLLSGVKMWCLACCLHLMILWF